MLNPLELSDKIAYSALSGDINFCKDRRTEILEKLLCSVDINLYVFSFVVGIKCSPHTYILILIFVVELLVTYRLSMGDEKPNQVSYLLPVSIQIIL